MKKPTIRDVAKAAGVSPMTVSYALRRHPKIPHDTAERIRKIAGELNYTPNPLLASLLTEVRARRKIQGGMVIGYLVFDRSTIEKAGKPKYTGALTRARELGFDMEVFELPPKIPGRRLTEVLLYRKVCGLICPAMPQPNMTLDIDLSLFPVVTTGHGLAHPRLHRVTISHYHSILTCMNRLRELGYRRIGLAFNSITNEKFDGLPVAGFDAFQRSIPAGEHVPLLMSDPKGDFPDFRPWYGKYRPDALLHTGAALQRWPQELGLRVPEDLAVATLFRQPDETRYAGLDANSFQIGYTTMDVLAQQIYTHQCGAPADPMLVLLKGKWVDGPSAPGKRQEREPH